MTKIRFKANFIGESIEEFKARKAATIAINKAEIEAAQLTHSQLIDELAKMKWFRDELKTQLTKERARNEKKDHITPVKIVNKSDNTVLEAWLRKDAKRSAEEGRIVTMVLFEEETIEKYQAKKRAQEGGKARANLFEKLEKETIRLYVEGKQNGKWESVPEAALEITPQIVAMSRHGNGDLSPTTTKPLEWIRAYNRRKK